jgi:hypothetical protein
MSVDAYIPEPQGLIVVNKIGGVTSPQQQHAWDEIEYKMTSK